MFRFIFIRVIILAMRVREDCVQARTRGILLKRLRLEAGKRSRMLFYLLVSLSGCFYHLRQMSEIGGFSDMGRTAHVSPISEVD